MMELDLWTEDFLLAREWGLDMPAVQPGGQYGDLKPEYRHDGDTLSCNPPQGAIEETTQGIDEEVLGLEEWMETSDLGTFLDALGMDGNKLLPLEDSLLNFSPSIAPDDSSVKQLHGTTHNILLDDLKAPFGVQHGDFDALRSQSPSPAPSPVQVSPIIKIEEYAVVQNELSPVSEDTSFISHEEFVVSGDFGSFITTEGSSSPGNFLGSPAIDVESTPTSSGPSSPESSLDSLIETSPELYKIISSAFSDKKVSTQHAGKVVKQCSKASSNTKSKTVRKRKPAEPVPEHVIMEHVNKKDRKKLQNKNAAIRYRMKKKEEAVTIKSEVQELEEINESLKTKVEDLSREIKYMKNLMEEVCKAKGIII